MLTIFSGPGLTFLWEKVVLPLSLSHMHHRTLVLSWCPGQCLQYLLDMVWVTAPYARWPNFLWASLIDTFPDAAAAMPPSLSGFPMILYSPSECGIVAIM